MSATMSKARKGLTVTLVGALLGLLAACSGGDSFGGGAGDTGRPITNDELTKMVLSLHQFGADVRGFAAVQGNGLQTLDTMSAFDFDPVEERGDLERSGFETGYTAAFTTTGDPLASGGVFTVGSGVIQFTTSDGAEGYFGDSLFDLANLTGRANAQGLVVAEATEFETASDSTAGAHVVMTQPDTAQLHGSEIMFRHGRLIGFVTVMSVGGAEFDRVASEARVAGLTAVMDQQVQFALAGSNVSNDDDDDGPLYVSSASDALGQSAEQFQDEVDSLSGNFNMQMTGASFNATLTGDFAFQAPDAMYMRFLISGTGSDAATPELDLTFDGLEVQMILDDDTLYLLTPFTGWVYMDAGDLGDESEALEDLLAGGGPIDYAALFDDIPGDIEDLGIEQSDAGSFRRYRLSMDVAELMEAIGQAAQGETLPAEGLAGTVTFDLWLHEDSLLPHKFEAVGQITQDGESVNFTMQMNFGGYGQPAVIPAPPADAVPIEDAFGDFEFDEDEVEEAFQEAFGEIGAGQ